MKILFVDNKREELERFLKLPFAKQHVGHIEYLSTPVGLCDRVEQNKDLRLIVLDMLWEQDGNRKPLMLGADAMRELSMKVPEVPVVIYSVLDNEEILRELVPEMIRLGAYDWISKDEPRMVRSFRFERAYMAGRDWLKRPLSRAVLAPDQQRRLDVHVALMFVDLTGFTALCEMAGGRAMLPILKEFYALVSREVIERGGYIDKYIGDAVMCIFGASAKQSNKCYTHVRDCVDAARMIQGKSHAFRLKQIEPLVKKHNVNRGAQHLTDIGSVRCAIESGSTEIARFERGNESELTFIGTPVNIAARILGEAKAGEIWAGENTCTNGLTPGEIIDQREVVHKNLRGTMNIYRIAP